MKRNIHKITIGCSLLLGVGLWAGFAVRFNTEDKLSYEPNPGCVKGSPYGKVLALAMQGPISFYWHQGKTCGNGADLKEDDASYHKDGAQHVSIKKAKSSCGAGCDSCGGHESEPPVVVQAKPEVDHSSGCGGCGACETQEKAKMGTGAPKKSLRELAKLQIKKMGATAERKTDGRPLSPAHVKYLQSVTEDKLRLAYELDPTNYTNYGNYHLFVATTSFGKSKSDDQKAVAIARETVEACKRDNVDPSSWITAASAAYNIIFHIGRYHDQFTIAEAKASLAEFDGCMATYEKLLAEAVENGRIQSVARLEELNTRAKYLTKLRHAQGVYMKRMMTTQMAGNPSSTSTH